MNVQAVKSAAEMASEVTVDFKMRTRQQHNARKKLFWTSMFNAQASIAGAKGDLMGSLVLKLPEPKLAVTCKCIKTQKVFCH